jgi:3-keto-5-aminohexanoate cleavage enzyme
VAKKVIVAVAPVGGNLPPGARNPVSPEEVARAVVDAANAGASLVHLHVRDGSGRQTADLARFSRTLDLVRAASDIVLQVSTGGVSTLSLEERCAGLEEPRVESASLNMGSANFDEGVYINTFPEIRYWARRMAQRSVVPELEIFEAGMIDNVRIIRDEGLLPFPPFFGLCFGFRGALSASGRSLFFLASLLPEGARWGVIHHGMEDLALLAAAAALGADAIRVGYEDSAFYAPGAVAPSNAVLVERTVSLVRQMGLEAASPAEARERLAIASGR